MDVYLIFLVNMFSFNEISLYIQLKVFVNGFLVKEKSLAQ